MPSRPTPKAYYLFVKTHKLTVCFTVHQSSTIAQLKVEALSALMSNVLGEADAPLPRVKSTEDFELCRAVKDKGKPSASYETLSPSMAVKGVPSNWETLYVQYRDEDGTLLPVDVSHPSLLEEEVEESRRAPLVQEAPPVATSKGKRKAPPE